MTLPPASNVVDFARFREERDRRRLPLFEEPDQAPAQAANPPLGPRPLSPGDVEHRMRMLQHLAAGRNCQ